ncbi:hypothetical protein VTO73DRAFT_1778 [Trametes versicolor]
MSQMEMSSDPVPVQSRRGLVWDRENWSCAYDSVLTIMLNLYLDFGSDWFATLAATNTYMDIVRARLAANITDTGVAEAWRDVLRDVLSTVHPTRFPRQGRSMAAVSDVLACLFYCPRLFGQSSMTCRFCTANFPMQSSISTADSTPSRQRSAPPHRYSSLKHLQRYPSALKLLSK